ncbi:MAG: toll/interleukin-1 receptor domain-containing protein [Chloroflexota bacterium]
MANSEQLKILKKGVDAWNKWREENPNVGIDLVMADLRRADLKKANLQDANLTDANLGGAFLDAANLYKANLETVNLFGASLEMVSLIKADLYGANLREARLSGANLSRAILIDTYLGEADIGGISLEEAILRRANLDAINLAKTILGHTSLEDIDLSKTKGLDEVFHIGPSPISSSTLESSKGKIPEVFLRGCGLSDWEIESSKLYRPGLQAKEVNDIVYHIYDLRANQAVQINPLFISYSHKDNAFVDTMEEYLDNKGIRFWRDIHDATSGRLEKVIDRAMRLNPTVLLVLSKDSVESDWVEHEARTARELEKEIGRDVLCPVALDEAWKDCRWPARLREQIMEYNILDFSNWKDEREFWKKFRKLVGGLDLFYKE